MPSSIHIIPATEFVVSKSDGILDVEQTKEYLRKTILSARMHEQSHLLLDLREASSRLRAFEVFELSSVLSDFDPPFTGKLVIINHPKDAFDRAEFFAKCARYRGFQVAAFHEFEEAIYWLYPKTEPLSN